MSVEKKGSPLPPAKITTSPASKAAWAPRELYPSATRGMSTELITRTGTPSLARQSCRARELINVASMPIWSARFRSISPLERPRQMLPPPRVTPTCTPRACRLWICRATASTFSKSTVSPWPPMASPESLRDTRLYFSIHPPFPVRRGGASPLPRLFPIRKERQSGVP